jgi:hypothetical protein
LETVVVVLHSKWRRFTEDGGGGGHLATRENGGFVKKVKYFQKFSKKIIFIIFSFFQVCHRFTGNL